MEWIITRAIFDGSIVGICEENKEKKSKDTQNSGAGESRKQKAENKEG
jgi:hypothetical protein